MSTWREQAREMIDGGMAVTIAARELGKSEYAVRFNLNINGFRDRRAASDAKAKEERSAAPLAKDFRSRSTIKRDRWRDAPAKPAPSDARKISLPKLNLPPLVEDSRPAIRFSWLPRQPAEAPGVTRIREIHLGMIRAGKIVGRDLVSEMRS